MQRIWLIFSQTVAICLAFVFVAATLRPAWVKGWLLPPDPPPLIPTATVKIQTPEASTAAASDASQLTNNTGIKSADKAPEKAPVITTMVTSYADAVKLAGPSVVNIYTTKNIVSPFKNLPDIPSLRPFIQEQKRLNDPTNLGSGVIASSQGYVLTNYHVVEAAESIEVGLDDGRKFSAQLIGADPDTDLAVLKIEATDIQPIRVNQQQTLHVGDVVLAIGNPFGVGQTTTMGIISALNRTGLGISTYENFIQTDAAINPGNSGGALINIDGSLIGINTAIYAESDSSGSLGIGFATPAQTALKIMDEIIAHGKVHRGWLGLEPQDVTADIAKAFNFKETRGVIIASIVNNGPAAKAGLMIGDIIIQLNTHQVFGVNQMMHEIASIPPQTSIHLKVLRNGKPTDVQVSLGERPASDSSKEE